MYKYLKSIYWKMQLRKSYFMEAYNFLKLTLKYNASMNTEKDIQKMQYTLSRETHTIEKGMSMRNPRKGFGQQKVMNLIHRLMTYVKMYGIEDPEFLDYPLSTIQTYFEYTNNNGVLIPNIQEEFNKLIKISGKTHVSNKAGVEVLTKETVLSQCNLNFESLLMSRHSIRYFSKEYVKDDDIKKALSFAQRTPSACNRQGWITHIFRFPQSVDLIKWQGGSHGFEDEIKCAILVTANLKAFLSYEVHQAYIDGGLYAMNLINALHSLGLGTIPLSCGFKYDKLSQLSDFNIPENEVPIVIIGVGHLNETFKVAISERKPIEKTTVWHTFQQNA